ncbi:MAG: 2-C-methyl-D-erythritol 4-phosphate cytidylyltransferase [Verrucomicrobia bacterium]|nr:2-C-methyl-D-erythritol 4-phosphate cytidylyltransferase [Verrucomicrobiota bacterium]
MNHTTALIVAAGSSRRMGFDKLSAPLRGKPVLHRTIDVFDACAAVDNICVVGGDAVRDLVQSWIDLGSFRKPVSLCAGGAERHLSVHEGLKQLSPQTEIVAVHDGARPLISPEQIARCIEKAREFKAVACARPVTETLKRADKHGAITGSIDRSHAWIMETPQVFDRELLCEAYELVLRDGLQVTDEVSAVQHLGAEVFVVENALPNLKITHPADIALAERLLGEQ